MTTIIKSSDEPVENDSSLPDIIVDQSYVCEIADSTFDTILSEAQLEELFYGRLWDNISNAVYDTIQDLLDEEEQAQIKKAGVYYEVQIKNPYSVHGIFKNFTGLRSFKSELQAQEYKNRQSEGSAPHVEYRIIKFGNP